LPGLSAYLAKDLLPWTSYDVIQGARRGYFKHESKFKTTPPAFPLNTSKGQNHITVCWKRVTSIQLYFERSGVRIPVQEASTSCMV